MEQPLPAEPQIHKPDSVFYIGRLTYLFRQATRLRHHGTATLESKTRLLHSLVSIRSEFRREVQARKMQAVMCQKTFTWS